MDRTEEDKLLRSSIVVTLGGKEYQVQPLVIKEAREWRKKLAEPLGKFAIYANATTDDPAGFETAVDGMLVTMPDQMIDLFFSYAKDLDREEIEATATEVELAKAVAVVLEVALPLLGGLTGALKKMGQ